MKRKAYDRILEWKAKFADKYALMLDGPRRVGKSWLAETFAQAEYKAYLLIDFSKVKSDVKDLFNEYLDDFCPVQDENWTPEEHYTDRIQVGLTHHACIVGQVRCL